MSWMKLIICDIAYIKRPNATAKALHEICIYKLIKEYQMFKIPATKAKKHIDLRRTLLHYIHMLDSLFPRSFSATSVTDRDCYVQFPGARVKCNFLVFSH